MSEKGRKQCFSMPMVNTSHSTDSSRSYMSITEKKARSYIFLTITGTSRIYAKSLFIYEG